MKTLFTILLLLSFFAAIAQKIHFADTSNIWKEIQPQYNFPGPTLYYYDTYNFISDTIIGSHSYKQFNFLYNPDCMCTSSFVREDTILKKVYIWNNMTDTETVLMDYNLHLGDTFNAPYNRFAVVKIDSTLINSIWHKVWCFSPLYGIIYGDTIHVIEGIGCTLYPTYMLWDLSGCVECMQPFIYCFLNRGITPPLSPAVSFLNNTTSCTYNPTLNEKAIPYPENQIAVYPNPATDELTIKMSNTQPITISLINMLGQTVKTLISDKQEVTMAVDKVPAGIYTVMLTNGNGERINTKVVINH